MSSAPVSIRDGGSLSSWLLPPSAIWGRPAATDDAAPIKPSSLPSAPSSDRSSPLTPQYLVWLSHQQWSTETSPWFELSRRIKYLSSVAGLGRLRTCSSPTFVQLVAAQQLQQQPFKPRYGAFSAAALLSKLLLWGEHHCHPILRGCATLGYCSAHHRIL